jgi:hypothetical protein
VLLQLGSDGIEWPRSNTNDDKLLEKYVNILNNNAGLQDSEEIHL